MNVADFDYDLPASYIAQTPAEPRDSAKLLRLDRRSGALSHHIFGDIVDMLGGDDVLVLNNSRVIPARLNAIKAISGGKAEILLLKPLIDRRWLALVGGRNIGTGTCLQLPGGVFGTVIKTLERSQRVIEFNQPAREFLAEQGAMPLPPYIGKPLGDSERYQTVYSEIEGSAAAPTAGLHFTHSLLVRLKRKGIRLATCTLHIGLDTFQPVSVERVSDHKIHREFASLDQHNAEIINEARQAGGRVVAVGTTSARAIETSAILAAGGEPTKPSPVAPPDRGEPLVAFEAQTGLFIYPGYQWRAVDAMISNFHLPRSTLLMMLSAFVGRETLLATYETAKQMNYRFYSFGDAMFIT
ncbi:MAG: tRNA preQ1(34) S-adenosylmethionine ribosyltransferase-isomerase QueA [Chloroflexi bacterium]|nr:tRNA preQ1(34) S-adenosylmethionine ribosyltransferase-isomerase QueA [Chloroflexota bacterium]